MTISMQDSEECLQQYIRSPCSLGLFQEGHDEDWYNKSLTALRMNNAHPSLSNPMLQYQT